MPVILTVLLLAAWWAVPSAIKAFVKQGFYECQAPAWTSLDKIGEVQSLWIDNSRSKAELAQSGRDLARLNAAYLLRLQQADAQDEELRRVEGMLYMPAQPQWRYVVARVVRRDLDTWWQQIVIRRGARDGIHKGDGVVYRDGVVGRVTEVHSDTSVVELVSSASFRVAAHVEGDLRPVTYVGTPAPIFRNPGGLATNIPADIQADKDKPARLVTSRLGGAFPDGLTIGFMSELIRESDGLFQRSPVQLNASLVGVEEVAVIVPSDRSTDVPDNDN